MLFFRFISVSFLMAAVSVTGLHHDQALAENSKGHEGRKTGVLVGGGLPAWISRRHLQELGSECEETDTRFQTFCSPLVQKRAEGRWADIFGIGICCAPTEDICCESSPGGIAHVAVGVPLLLALITLGSCCCCSRCPYHEKLTKKKQKQGTTVAEEPDQQGSPAAFNNRGQANGAADFPRTTKTNRFGEENA